MQRIITKIEPLTPMPKRKRVAAYARVSSGKDAMLHSLSAQVSYFNSYIQNHQGWEYAGVYVDEALTGTKDSRAEFQRMLSDCRAGLIDMVITKSISRFARNTVTLLEAVRELRQLGIEVWFQQENIHSLSGDGELMMTILASYAQEESRSVSENCKWRIKKMFSEGRTNNGTMLGYRLRNGIFHIVPEEAEIVRMIFTDFLSGMGQVAICKKLNTMEIPSKRGVLWGNSSVRKILRCEKYAGDMLLQKTFLSDHISKKQVLNRGEQPSYHVRDSHEAIIDKETFERVQSEIQRRAAVHQPSKATIMNDARPTAYPFTSKLRCAQCGKNYRRKIACAGGKYEKPIWSCPTYNHRWKAACAAQQIPEDILQEVSTEVMGLTAFDEALFASLVSEIQILADNQLIFVHRDGHEVKRRWAHRSRSEGWSEAARANRQETVDRRKQL